MLEQITRKLRPESVANVIGFCGSGVLCEAKHKAEGASDRGRVGSGPGWKSGNGKILVLRQNERHHSCLGAALVSLHELCAGLVVLGGLPRHMQCGAAGWRETPSSTTKS